MKKVLSLIAILCMAVVFFAGCESLSLPTEKAPCEHKWIDATCIEPKTCSLCGETEGAALGHIGEADDGDCTTAVMCANEGCEYIFTAAKEHNPDTDDGDCTTAVMCTNEGCEHTVIVAKEHNPGADDGNCTTAVKCANEGCEQNAAEALSHTPDTDDGNCTTAVHCTNEGCQQNAVEASSHTPADDDGDVTTPVLCANEGCNHICVQAKEAITLTIHTFENGSVTADKKNYAIGDTVKLKIIPEFDYTQKLYINGEALMLGWNTYEYSFEVTENTYEITGSFEKALDCDPKDAARWDTSNQAHGVLTTYYPNDGSSWWMYIKGDYSSITIKAKNHLPVDESMDDGANSIDGYQQILSMTINGKLYAFRLYNDKGTYAVSCTAVSGAVTGWTNWKNVGNLLGYSINNAMAGDGVKFKIERTSANVITVSVNDVKMFEYTMEGVTAEDKVTSVGIQQNYNQGEYVEIPFELTLGCDHEWVDATCTEPKTCSKCEVTVGEANGHTYTDYVSNGDATCDKDGTKTGECACGETNTVDDEGSAGHKDDDTNYICDTCGENLCTIHVPADDDGNCTTPIRCTVCGTVTTEGNESHTPEEDDGNLATAVMCSNEGCSHICVPAIVISTFENGSVATDAKSYKVGDTVTLTVAPADGYAQKLYINGNPILVDTNSQYSFVVEECEKYEITGEFVSTSGKWYWTAEYGMLNQAHGYIHAPAVSEKNGELVPTANKCYGGKVLLTDPSGGTKVDYGVYLKMTFSDGSSTAIRLVAKDSAGNYFIQAMGGILGDQWKWYYDLSAEENAAITSGKGVWFGLYLDKETNTLKVTINGTVRNRADITPTVAEGLTIQQFKIQTYNYSYAVDFKCEFFMTE